MAQTKGRRPWHRARRGSRARRTGGFEHERALCRLSAANASTSGTWDTASPAATAVLRLSSDRRPRIGEISNPLTSVRSSSHSLEGRESRLCASTVRIGYWSPQFRLGPGIGRRDTDCDLGLSGRTVPRERQARGLSRDQSRTRLRLVGLCPESGGLKMVIERVELQPDSMHSLWDRTAQSTLAYDFVLTSRKASGELQGGSAAPPPGRAQGAGLGVCWTCHCQPSGTTCSGHPCVEQARGGWSQPEYPHDRADWPNWL